MAKRFFIIVLDSFGIGYEPDADKFGDVGSNTLKSVCTSSKLSLPYMQKLGLFNCDGVAQNTEALNFKPVGNPEGTFARLQEKSMGKDTTIGHWEIAGVISKTSLPTYPNGFPADVIDSFEKQTGKGTLCNKPYSGTEVIKDYGREAIKEDKLIVYTSADSVFQIAAHEDHISVEELYRYCEIARNILVGKHGVGRVIARPFTGAWPYTRTSNRHDFSLKPPSPTMLDALQEAGLETLSVGKIYDIFAGKSVSEVNRISDNADGMRVTSEMIERDFEGLCFVNLVDFDMKFGHRRDIDGYANALTEFDTWLGEKFLPRMRNDDILIITADHGCDPGYTATTDHTREYVPMLMCGPRVPKGINLGTRTTFADISATVLDYFDVDKSETAGTSFLNVER